MAQHLITTTAALQPCNRCGAWTFIGHAEGVLARTDPIPLTAVDELAALLDGRTTYNLHAELLGRRFTLHQRTAVEIAAPRRAAVVGTHRCHRPMGTMPAPPPEPPPAPPDDGTVPF